MHALRVLAVYLVVCLNQHVSLERTIAYIAIAGYGSLALGALYVVLRSTWERRPAVRDRAVLRATRTVLDAEDWKVAAERQRSRANHPAARG